MNDAPLMLSVSGLRGLIGQSLTPEVATRYGAAVGSWFNAHQQGAAAHVVVGRDSRPSGQMIELAVTAGLISVGCRVTRVGIVTTPGVAIMVEHLQADGGIVITASHNPIIWNGIKTLRHDGVAPPPDQAQQIIDRFQNNDVHFADVESLQPAASDDTACRVHVDRVLPHVDVGVIRAAKLKVVVDSVQGAGGPEAKLLLDELGVELVHLWGEPTGLFPHTPEPIKENLTALADATREHGADFGCAQDPDADRLAIVDEQGNYIGEEYTLALCVKHLLEQTSDGAKGATLAANLSTSRMIDDLAEQYGARVIRTPVGEANVAAAMREHEAIVGGEGNGGIIWPKVIHVRDSLVGMALILEMLAKRKQPLSTIAGEIPTYAIVKEKVDVDEALLTRMNDALSNAFANETLNTADGVRIDWPNRWVHVRASNTEPIIRLIAEAPDFDGAHALIQQVRDALGLNQPSAAV